MPPALRHLALIALTLAVGADVHADMVVVGAARNNLAQLSREEAVNIWLGRYRRLPGGQAALPIDLPSGSEERNRFYRLLVGKEPAEINAYWTRLVFSGKTRPPYQARNLDEVWSLLAREPGAVAYLDRAMTDARMKILLELER